MFIQYNNLDINFTIGSTRFRTLNIAYEHLHRIIPSHSHGDNSYEIHYVVSGRGYIKVGEQTHEITPNTLYLAGPHVAHAQISLQGDPMVDYCIYLRLHRTSPGEKRTDDLDRLFTEKTFWIGQDNCQIKNTLEQLFRELKEQKTGYTVYVETLLRQLIVQMIRRNTGRSPGLYHRGILFVRLSCPHTGTACGQTRSWVQADRTAHAGHIRQNISAEKRRRPHVGSLHTAYLFRPQHLLHR